jgi:excisionase family DNA binding protein
LNQEEAERVSEPLAFMVPEALVERIAERAAEKVLAQLDAGNATAPSPYLTVAEAAASLRCKPQRVYDLLSARRLTRYKDGSRVLISRSELHFYLAGSGSSRIVPALSPAARNGLRKGLPG